MSLTNEEVLAAFKKQPLPFICGTLALILAVAAYFRGLDMADLETRLEERSAEGERQTTNIKNATLLPEQLASLTAANAAVEQRLIKASELAKNSQYFYKLETETGTKLVDLRPLGIAPTKGPAKNAYSPVPYSLSVQGDFLQLLTFLRRLENGTHFCRVTSAVFGSAAAPSSTETLGPSGVITINLSLDLLGQP